jgi:nitrogenase molybdenum-iron protein alpha/beta subunit
MEITLTIIIHSHVGSSFITKNEILPMEKVAIRELQLILARTAEKRTKLKKLNKAMEASLSEETVTEEIKNGSSLEKAKWKVFGKC